LLPCVDGWTVKNDAPQALDRNTKSARRICGACFFAVFYLVRILDSQTFGGFQMTHTKMSVHGTQTGRYRHATANETEKTKALFVLTTKKSDKEKYNARMRKRAQAKKEKSARDRANTKPAVKEPKRSAWRVYSGHHTQREYWRNLGMKKRDV
jgi:hypothetical protein